MQDKVIRLRRGRLGKLRPNHPWIYKRQILKVDPSIKPGEIVSIKTSEDKFIGVGYYNPKSEITVRLVSFNDEQIDKNFFDNRIKTAVKKRIDLLARTNAYRA